MKEKWKTIEDYPDYEVSNFGRVISNKFGKKKLRKLLPVKAGYIVMKIYKNGSSNTFNLHRIVAELFIPNPDNKPCINHKDGNKTNNHINNIEWVTHSENQLHSYKIGLNSSNTHKKLTMKEVMEIRKLYPSGEYTYKTLGKIYGVSITTIHGIVKNIKYKK